LTSDLIVIDPATGALINNIGPIRGGSASGPVLSIADIAIQPGTGQLFGVDPSSGAETLIGSTGLNFVGALAFQPVPEPGSIGLLALGIIGLAYIGKRKLNGT
jgi:hypothetical protein